MNRDELADLGSFAAVAEERSFTKAAARLNVSQSALSHAVRRLEDRLGVRLLDRSTRNVSTTHAGDKLLATVAPALADISAQLQSLSKMSGRPAGKVRIVASEFVTISVLMPKVVELTSLYPELSIEISSDLTLPDIVGARFDAGVKIGEQVDQDMIAIPIGPELRMAIVATPGYFKQFGTPRTPQDLQQHVCINYRRQATGRIYEWEFEKGDKQLTLKAPGRLCFNTPKLVLEAALRGAGVGCVVEDLVCEHLSDGTLKRVLLDWCAPFPGYHIYYASRRHNSEGLKLLVNALRYSS